MTAFAVEPPAGACADASAVHTVSRIAVVRMNVRIPTSSEYDVSADISPARAHFPCRNDLFATP
jgi:hypothetical protein